MNPQVTTPTPENDGQHSPDINPTATNNSDLQASPVRPVSTTAVIASHHNPVPQVPLKTARTYSLLKLVLVILLIIVITGTTGGYAISQINKNQKSYSGSSGTGNWVSHNSADGSFSALFPTEPTVEPQDTRSQNGVSYTVDVTQSGNNDTAYAVVRITYPSSVTLPTGTTGLDDAVQTEKNQLKNSQLVSSNYITVGGHQAESYEITGTKNGASVDLTGEVIPINQVLYNVVTTQTGSSRAPHSQYFLNNFKLGQQ